MLRHSGLCYMSAPGKRVRLSWLETVVLYRDQSLISESFLDIVQVQEILSFEIVVLVKQRKTQQLFFFLGFLWWVEISL